MTAHTLLGAAQGVGIALMIYVGTYLLAYGLAARRYGYRLWTRRRLAALWTGRADVMGGPMDGQMFPVSRRGMLGVGLEPWPDVLFNAYTRTYRVGSYVRGNPIDPCAIWAGYYILAHLSDCYRWHGTGLELYAANLVDGAA